MSSSSSSTKLFHYLKNSFNIQLTEGKIKQLMDLYVQKEKQPLIDEMMKLLYDKTFSEILTDSKTYKPIPKPKSEVKSEASKIIVSLNEKIRQLELEIKHLNEDKDELRTNYWNLKESINKSKQSKSNGVSLFNGV